MRALYARGKGLGRPRIGAALPEFLKASAAVTHEAIQRLERLEHGMEAIAIEIERVSEGQRFVTRLLSSRDDTARIDSGSKLPL